jgi:hypothetical protein
VRKADNLPSFCAVVKKSGNLNFLEPSGPLRASNGSGLPFFCLLDTVYCKVHICDGYDCVMFEVFTATTMNKRCRMGCDAV